MSRRSAPTLTPRLFDRRRGRAPGIGAWDGGQPIALADALGVTRKLQVEKWAWLIGLSDADDSRLLEWARSFATPPQVKAEGARLQSPAYNTERRAALLTVEKPIVSLTITPSTPCVHPVFELHQAPKTLARIELRGQPLPANDYAWDGRTLWLNTTLRGGTSLRLMFKDQSARDGPFQRWQASTAATSATYPGANGHTSTC